jgi:hypothetical protein
MTLDELNHNDIGCIKSYGVTLNLSSCLCCLAHIFISTKVFLQTSCTTWFDHFDDVAWIIFSLVVAEATFYYNFQM